LHLVQYLFARSKHMKATLIRSLFGLALVLFCMGADWPGFRGPAGNGISDERGLPVKWSATENLVWKTKLPGPGASSPIVSGDRVFVTCWSGYGETKGAKGSLENLKRHLVCLDRKTGDILWKTESAAQLPELEYRTQVTQHGYTTSTPITDGERVYVYYGRSGAYAFDLNGKELWHADTGKMLNNFGSGASPILYRNLLIVNATIERGAIMAFDKSSGKEVWRTRVNGDCWATPVIVEVGGDKREVVLSSQGAVMGYDPDKGTELWECILETGYASAMPAVKGDVVYVMGADSTGRTVAAIRAGGRGDVTKTHIIWKQQKVGAGYTSPLLIGDYLYFFSNQAVCVKAADGEVMFQERMAGLGTEYGSPVAADGRIYLFTRKGVGHVVAAKEKFEALAQNELGGDFVASPAVSGGRLFIRDREFLYCIGAKK
jgi:outer membrane protein assembly factor BamB